MVQQDLLSIYTQDGDFKFDISIGFEFETADAFVARLDEAFLTTVSYEDKTKIRQSGFPMPLAQQVEITGDFLNQNFPHVLRNIQEYKKSKQHIPYIGLSIKTGIPHAQDVMQVMHLVVPRQAIKRNHLFGTLEFICTFPEMVRVEAKELIFHLPVYIVEAEKRIRRVFENTFTRTFTVLDRAFPSRRGVYSSDTNIAVFFYKGSEDIYRWQFVPQVTFGIDYRHLTRFILYFVHHMDTVMMERDNSMIQSVAFFRQCHDLENARYRDYLFLLYYSFTTGRTKQGKSRKPFLFRFLFSNLWRRWIGEKGRRVLWDYLSTKLDADNPFLEYFATIHVSKTAQQQRDIQLFRRRRQQVQDMDDSTLYDERFPMVFVEYRLLYIFTQSHDIPTNIFYHHNR